MTVHVLHENPEWLPPFAAALDAEGIDWDEVPLTGGELDLDAEPPAGVWWSRVSASAHTRGHAIAAEHARAVLDWLAGHGRRVVNGRDVLELELSKTRQLTALRAAGVEVPRTIAVIGADPARLVAAARRLPAPFLLKPNRGGKGVGVRRFDAVDELAAAAAAGEMEPPVDGVTLVQEYVAPAEPFITRVEVVGGEVVYAVTADTGRGGFQLCPADACAVDGTDGRSLFAVATGVEVALAAGYLGFAARHGVEVAGFEFLRTAAGRVVTYDVNTNTNYNPGIEAAVPRPAARAVARLLGRLDAAAG